MSKHTPRYTSNMLQNGNSHFYVTTTTIMGIMGMYNLLFTYVCDIESIRSVLWENVISTTPSGSLT